jgi:hypothetical protein
MNNIGVVLVALASVIVGAFLAYVVLSPDDSDVPATAASVGHGDSTGSSSEAGLAKTVAGAYPKIELETDHYDMGIISNSRSGEGRIKVYNRGGAPLKISGVATSCGCTQGKMSADVIKPGGEAYINVTVDPFRIPAFDSTKTLTISSNDPSKGGKVSVKVTVKVNPEIAWEPKAMDFGDLEKGQSSALTVRVRQVGDQEFELQGAEGSDRGRFTETTYAKVPQSAWQTSGHPEYDITVTVLPTAPPGPRRVSLNLLTNLTRLQRVVIPVTMNIVGVYSLSTQRVTLRSIDAGEEKKGVLTITSKVPLELVSAESTNDSLKMSYHEGDVPNSFVFDVKVADDPGARLQQDVWTIKLKADGKEYTETVQVLGVLSLDATKAVNESKQAPAVVRQAEPPKKSGE